MKINVEIDCSPEEARRFMGLPDLTPVHDAFVRQITDSMKTGLSPDLIASMTRAWGPMGDAGLKLWNGLLDQVAGSKTP